MCGYGIPEVDIARVLDIDPKTLRKHYRRELDTAFVHANARVAQSLFNQATSGNNVAAAIFWLKVRAGWRDRITVENINTTVSDEPEAEARPTEDDEDAAWLAEFGNGKG
jgi:hypothetical protein